MHIHVAEGPDDDAAGARLAGLARPNWLLVHAVYLADELPGTIVHNPRSNMNNSVGYARPTRFTNPVVLGTDGIGADLLEEFRLAYARLREHDIAASPETPWAWLTGAAALMADVAEDVVTWSSDPMDPWHLAFSPGVHPTEVSVGGRTLLQDGHVLSADAAEIRAKAAEQAARLFARL